MRETGRQVQSNQQWTERPQISVCILKMVMPIIIIIIMAGIACSSYNDSLRAGRSGGWGRDFPQLSRAALGLT